MASGYDISASSSTASAANSSAGPAISGGVSIGDIILGGDGSGGSGFSVPVKANQWIPVILLTGVLAGGWWITRKKGA